MVFFTMSQNYSHFFSVSKIARSMVLNKIVLPKLFCNAINSNSYFCAVQVFVLVRTINVNLKSIFRV